MTLHCFLGLCLNGVKFLKHLGFALFSLCSTWASFLRPLLAFLFFFFFSLSQWQHFCDWLNASAGPQGGWEMERKKYSCVTVRAFIVALYTMPACTTLCVTLLGNKWGLFTCVSCRHPAPSSVKWMLEWRRRSRLSKKEFLQIAVVPGCFFFFFFW